LEDSIPAVDVGDMPPEEFRRIATDAVEWISRYLSDVGDLPVMPDVEPGWVHDRLPPRAPQHAESMDEVMRDFHSIIVPAVTHWNHPSFYGYFANTGSGPGILGEMLAAALNLNAMVWRSSPAGTELEEHVTAWLGRMIGLPEAFHGVINDTASSSSLFALAAARERALPEARVDGLAAAPPVRIYTSAESHSSIDKAGMTLGFGRAGVARIEVDENFRMRPEALAAAIRADRAAGRRPLAVVATIGTTSTTSVDPVSEIADLCEDEGLWLHVDAAYAGPAAVVPELQHHFVGWHRADSIVVNPHKWLFTPMDCSVLFCRRPEALREAFSLTPEYLRTREEGVGTNLMDYGVPLGRRFRSLKLWFVLRYFGEQGVAARIREHCRLADQVAVWLDEAEDWEIAAPHPFATVVFRWKPAGASPAECDRLNAELMEGVNRGGEAFLSHSSLRGRTVLRWSVGNLRTTEAHLARTWTVLREVAERLSR
jgi:aromatic-L-amino-acid decarboxylase